VLYKDHLYLQVMHRNAQLLLALDAATGSELWKVERKGYSKGESPDVYASAFIWEGEGGPLLITHGNDYCTAHQLETGAEVWRVAGLNPSNNGAWRFVSSPLVTPKLIVVPSCKNGPTVGINPVGAKGSIDADNAAELWRINYTPDVVSPLLVGDVVYLMGDGPLTAVEAKTGKQIYKESLAKELHRAHMVATKDRIYIIGREGTTDVVEAGHTFKKIATNTLKDKFYSSPAVSGGRIYLRGWNYLWAIGK
jgi:outer membrane protein assembly factor BamB